MTNKDTEEKIGELKILENQLRGFLVQKQAIQLEINEINNALEELKKTNDEVYKIVAGVMIRAEKTIVNKELSEKKKIMEARIFAMEKQEKLLEKNSCELRNEVDEEIQRDKQKNKN